MKIKKGIPLIDQHNKNYLYGKKFGGNYIPETLKKPVEDLTKLFEKLRYEKKFLAPDNSEVYLEKIFGKSWRTPDKKQFFWNKNKFK